MTTLRGQILFPYAWRLGLLLAAAAALGMQLLGSEVERPSPLAEAASPRSKPSQAMLAEAAASYPDIALYPLFNASRQAWRAPPPAPRVMAPPPPPPPRPAPVPPRGYVLIGLVATSNHATALLRGYNGRTVLLTPGQVLDGWRVRGIDHGRVRLEAQGATYDIAFPVLRLTGRAGGVP